VHNDFRKPNDIEAAVRTNTSERKVMRTWKSMFTVALLVSVTATAQQTTQVAPVSASLPQSPEKLQALSRGSNPGQPPIPVALHQPTTRDQVVDRFIEREHGLMNALSMRAPVAETYLQNLKADPQLGSVPSEDHYFLGSMDMGSTVDRTDYLKQQDKSMESRLMGGFNKLFKMQYQPLGFSWMVYVDRSDFDRAHYEFHYVRREFLGDIRCLVFDVTPKKDSGRGRFLGRLWVEDQDFNIVRLNGTYTSAPHNAYYFHMDSWRLNLIPGYWVPAYIYSEEGDFSAGAKSGLAFKAQTRIWGYDLKKEGKDDELTQIRVDSVKDETASTQDASPLQAKREWQQQAEDNVLDRLTAAGLLAPEGDVDRILQTVINNMVVTNNIDLSRPVRARVLLTSPLETFSVGNTIVISRGLVDVIPDEASLAAILSHELAHIVLGHNLGSKYAFNDRMLFSDDSTYSNLGFKHIPQEEEAAENKAIELLKNSPYGQKLDSVSLFLKALRARAPEMKALLTTHLGNPLFKDGNLLRLEILTKEGPALDNEKLDQIAALPLGGRLKINPWNDTAEMVKAAPIALTSARDKMPFEVTPFYPRLARYGSSNSPNAAPTTAAATSASAN
jgi:peptidase M48-like protein